MRTKKLHAESGLGIYALSAIIVDKAEPSEALKANVVWSLGMDNPRIYCRQNNFCLEIYKDNS
jgi:hypothetical protein